MNKQNDYIRQSNFVQRLNEAKILKKQRRAKKKFNSLVALINANETHKSIVRKANRKIEHEKYFNEKVKPFCNKG